MASFATRMFRTRNSARDASTDAERLDAVRQALFGAIESAKRERDGLKRRVDTFYAQASALLDQSGEYGERSPKEEQAIAEAERTAAIARQRIEAVDAQIEQFASMLRVAQQDDVDRQNVA